MSMDDISGLFAELKDQLDNQSTEVTGDRALQRKNLHVFLALVTLVCLLSLSIPVKSLKGYSGDLIEAYFSDKPITADGFASGEDWAGFNAVSFPSADGVGTDGFYIKYDAESSKIYASLYVWGDGTFNVGDTVFLYLDTEHDGGDKPDADDFMFVVTRGGSVEDYGYNEATDSWDINLGYTSDWEAYYMSVGSTWGATWIIPTALTDNQRMGIAISQYNDRPPTGLSAYYPSALHPLIPNTWAEVIFSKLDTSITVSASPASTAYGETMSLSATINQAVSRGTVTMQYSKDGDVWTNITSGTPSDGRLSCAWSPPAVGLYNIRALWTGDIVCRASTSTLLAADVQKASSSTSTSLSASTITYSEGVTITCNITPPLSEGLVTVEYSPDKISWNQIDASAPSEGSYSVAWTPQSAGTYYVRTSWSGTENCLGSTSPEETLIVDKAPTNLQLSVFPETVQIDPQIQDEANVEVSGSLTPALAGVDVTVTYTSPDGTTTTVTTTTTSSGEFSDTLSLGQGGNWSVSASWAGNTNYAASSSSPINVNVKVKTADNTADDAVDDIVDDIGDDTGENWPPYVAGAAIIAIVVAFIAFKMGPQAVVSAVVSIAGALRGAIQKLNVKGILNVKSIIGKRSDVPPIIRVRCLKCNGLNDEASFFCGHCGTRLRSQSA